MTVVSVLPGIKSTNKVQQLMDFNTVCYDKVLDQVKKGYQVRYMKILHYHKLTLLPST